MNLKNALPWWAKLGAKIVLSRLPVSYSFWQRMNLFVHGGMDREDYAWKVVKSHLDRTGMTDLQGKVVMEFGPGDSLFSAVIARSLGAERTYLVDAGSYANRDIEAYRRVSTFLRARGLPAPVFAPDCSLEDVLADSRAVYLSEGVSSLQTIPTGSVDLIFSQAVMEHVRAAEISRLVPEFRRIIKPGGAMSHQIDLKDHLAKALNNLRFSDEVWESKFFVNSGFYTNRVRFGEFLEVFARSGFDCRVADVRRWDRLPTNRRALATRFADVPDEDLLVAQFDLVATPSGPGVRI